MNTSQIDRTRSTLATKLLGGSALAVVALLSATSASAAQAAAAAEETAVEEVVVTGTSIRGVAPVGANVMAVGQQDIQNTGAQTVQQVLRSVPAVVGMGSVGQGGFGSADGAGTNAPTIHGLGASASNSTLILIDGHRLPLSGINHTLADPNILPPLALERVEVLAEGASSVYGSDAVAGVINFITRRRYDGIEARGQYSFADGYKGYSGGIVAGKTWDTGSLLVAYGYSERDGLLASKRELTASRDRRARGGSNLASLFCSPATIQVGSGNIITAPYTGAGVPNNAANAMCDYSGLADLIPAEKRHSVLVKATQDLNDKVTLNGDLVYSNRRNLTRNTRGTIQATIFGPGSPNASQINPFFVRPAGSTATSETIRFDANELLGPGAQTEAGEETAYVSGGFEYKITNDWRATVGGVLGFSNSFTDQTGQLCGSCALLALNGTTNGGGNLTTPSIPNTSTIVLNTPLTAANALDVFGVGSANRTSAAVLQRLTDSRELNEARQTLKDATIKLEGPLFTLPAGQVRVAVGGEYIAYTLKQNIVRPLGTGPASTGSGNLRLDYDRNVKSAYAEVLIPVVGPEMEIPLVRRFDISASGRYDKYNDFGSTTNPRIAANWEPVQSLKFRGSYAKSFVAPALTSIGSDGQGTTGETSIALFNGNLNVPVAAYPNIVGLPGCTAGMTTCTIGGGVAGLQINGGNPDLQPQKGTSWSLGADFTPEFVPGLRVSATYWSNKLTGAITAPQAAFAVNAAGLNNLLTIYPGGASQAQIAQIIGNRPLTASVPGQVFFTYNFQQRNALNLWVEGVDVSVSYDIDTDYGRFGIDAVGSYKTRFDQQVGTGGAIFSVLGTTGFNTTFPSIKLETRVGLNWTSNFGLSANVFWNHTGPYRNWSGTTVTPLVRNAAGVPTGGGDRVKAGNFIDFHAAYDFQGEGFTRDLQVFIDVNNVFDRDPPFYNNNNGFDQFSGNPLGRLVSIGLKKEW
jgi:iron complex outermembrane receptor protein